MGSGLSLPNSNAINYAVSPTFNAFAVAVVATAARTIRPAVRLVLGDNGCSALGSDDDEAAVRFGCIIAFTYAYEALGLKYKRTGLGATPLTCDKDDEFVEKTLECEVLVVCHLLEAVIGFQ
ncbi:hypothetical protein Trydic_g2774 [Trypoxylus dichotomus]